MDDETAAVAIYYCLKKRQRKKRKYVRFINQSRNEKGVHQSLLPDMKISDPCMYFSYMRMSAERFELLLSTVGHRLFHRPTHRLPISAAQRLVLTLWFMASGDSYHSLAFSYRIGLATVSKIIKETSEVLWDELMQEFLPVPTRLTWRQIAEKFWKKWQFPLCCGAIDGKHITLRKPAHSGSEFYNYKGSCSIILMAVVDADYKFTFVEVGSSGCEGDAGVFDRSQFGERLKHPNAAIEDGGLELPGAVYLPGTTIKAPHVFVGDDAFPLGKNLLKPYNIRRANNQQRIFNYRLSRARCIVENAFGILTTRWRILETKCGMSVEAVELIVKACIVLHNYLKSTDACESGATRYAPEYYVDYESEDHELQPGQWRSNATEDLLSCRPAVRRSEEHAREIFNNFFNSQEGKVPWQERIALRGVAL